MVLEFFLSNDPLKFVAKIGGDEINAKSFLKNSKH